MTSKYQPKKWYHERKWAAIISPLALLGAYIMVSLAINSGSFLQYGVGVALACLSINRFVHVILVSLGKAHQL